MLLLPLLSDGAVVNSTSNIANDPGHKLYDKNHGVRMGVKDDTCDDAMVTCLFY